MNIYIYTRSNITDHKYATKHKVWVFHRIISLNFRKKSDLSSDFTVPIEKFRPGYKLYCTDNIKKQCVIE
jgi:hypothetical protein